VEDPPDRSDVGRAAIRGGAVRIGSYVAGVLLSAVATPLVTRHLGEAGYGRYVFVTQVIAIVAALTDVGLANLGIRAYELEPLPSRDRLMRDLLGLRGSLTIAGGIGAVVFAVVTDRPSVVVAGTAIAGIGFLITVIQTTYQTPLATALRLNAIAVVEFSKQAVTVAATIVLVAVGASLLPFYAVTIAGGLVALGINLWILRGKLPYVPAFDGRRWQALLRNAPAYAVASAIGFIYFRLEVVMVALLGTANQAGSFGVSFRIVEILAAIPLFASVSLFPLLVRAGHDDEMRLASMAQRMTDVYVLGGAALGLSLVVGAPLVIQVAAGGEFDGAVTPLRLMGGALFATFLISAWGYSLLALNRFRSLLYANVGALVLAAILTVALVPDHGATGGAIAGALTEVALAIAYIVMLARAGVSLVPALSTGWRVAVASAAALGVASASGRSSGVALVIALAIFVAGVVLMRALPREALDAFRARRG
jgi:O-antigen/teichoic acid export membrane protein